MELERSELQALTVTEYYAVGVYLVLLVFNTTGTPVLKSVKITGTDLATIAHNGRKCLKIKSVMSIKSCQNYCIYYTKTQQMTPQ